MKELLTKQDFDDFITKEAGPKLVVIDFYADWCGPCKKIAPILEKMSEDLTDVCFAKVNVDENSDTAEALKISAMPTFKLFKDGKEVAEIVGANEAKLREIIQQHK